MLLRPTMLFLVNLVLIPKNIFKLGMPVWVKAISKEGVKMHV